MKMLDLNTNGLRRGTLAAFAACGLIIAASQCLAVRAGAEEATPDYVAPLDMTSTYADPFDIQKAAGQPTLAARDTTGVNSAPDSMDAAASPKDETDAYPEDFLKFGP